MKTKSLITTTLLIAIFLILPLQTIAIEVDNEESPPDISGIKDKILSVDKIIGERLVKYYEHIIGDVVIKGDSVLIHNDPVNGDTIKFEKTWTDIDFEIPIFQDFEPNDHIWKKKVVFPDEEDLAQFYSFNEPQDFPVICWEVRHIDGTTILYDISGVGIGEGIPTPSEGFLLSGPHYDDSNPWEDHRLNAEFWYSRWCDSYISIFNPYPSTEISPRVSDSDVELFYELAHGDPYYFKAHFNNNYYSSNVAYDMNGRPPMKFAFIGSCEGMTNTGSGTFSYEFRKGQMTDTFTIGFDHMQNSDGMQYEIPWQNRMFALMDQGLTIKESFDLASAQYPVIEPVVKFVGDEDLKIRELVNRNPIVPYYPSPSDNVDNRDIELNLVWSGGDHDYWNIGPMAGEYDTVTYEIYLDTNSNPSTKIGTIGPFPADQLDFSFDPGTLEYDTQYYWKIVAIDNHGAETTSPIWSFKTACFSEDQLDQHNTQFDIGGFTIREGYKKAQSFKPSKNVLSKISLFIKKSGTPFENLEMIICDDGSGEPDINNEIVSVSLSPDYIDRNFSWIEFDFFDVSVTAGETYYIILQSSSGTDLTDCYEWGSSSSNVYPGGKYWSSMYDIPTSNWVWGSLLSRDFCFKTYGFDDTSENGLDQKQTEVDSEVILAGPGYTGFIGYNKIAQSFVPSLNTLSKIKLMVKKEGAPSSINIVIKSDLYGNDLTAISIPSEEIPEQAEIVEFDFPDISIIPDDTYFIVISTGEVTDDSYYRIAAAYDTEYVKGSFYRYEKTNWVSRNDMDLWFKTYGVNSGPETYELTINIQGEGTVTKDPDQSMYTNGTVVTLTANPETGYVFSHWSEDLTSSENPVTIIMDSNKTIAAVFVNSNPDLDQEQTQFDLGFKIYHAPDGDWGGAQTFKPTKNTLTRVEIYLRKFGTPQFNLIVQLREETPTGNLLNEVIFTPSEIITSWDWLNVNFDDTTLTLGGDYCIVVSPPPSSVTNNDGYEWGYAQGNVYDNGCYWHTRDGGEQWISLPTNYDFCFKTYGTNNSQETYTLTINIEGAGTVTKDPNLATYTHGTQVTITAIPDDNNNIFHHWTGNLTGYDSTMTITMDSDKIITANFTLRGDVNCDGTVGAADITYLQEIMFENLEEIPPADVNQDGEVNVEDIQTIEQIFLGYTSI